MRSMSQFMTATLLAAGCSSGKGESDDTGGSDTADTSDSGPDDGVSPVIEEADSWCYVHTTGEKQYIWVANVQADDRQGTDTLESFITDGIVVLSGETELAEYALVCDADGACTGTWKQSEDNIACANATSYTIRMQVQDEDGNRSEAVEVQGRQGTDASGR